MRTWIILSASVPETLPPIRHLMQPFMNNGWLIGLRILAVTSLLLPLLSLLIQLRKEKNEDKRRAEEVAEEPTLDELLERSRALREG